MTLRFRLVPKDQMRAELEDALARYTGPITRCPPAAANAPGINAKELEQRLAKDAERERRTQRERDDDASD